MSRCDVCKDSSSRCVSRLSSKSSISSRVIMMIEKGYLKTGVPGHIIIDQILYDLFKTLVYRCPYGKEPIDNHNNSSLGIIC